MMRFSDMVFTLFSDLVLCDLRPVMMRIFDLVLRDFLVLHDMRPVMMRFFDLVFARFFYLVFVRFFDLVFANFLIFFWVFADCVA